MRTRAAARYLAGRVASARLGAINRSQAVGLRFLASTPDYQFAAYADGNGNGIRTIDIQAGVDSALGPSRQLGADFRGVHFGLAIGLPDVDAVRNTSSDGVRIGTARILTMSPDGTATSGTLYVQGARAQYAVRVLGATGRTRVLKYEPDPERGSVRERSTPISTVRLRARRHYSRHAPSGLSRARGGPQRRRRARPSRSSAASGSSAPLSTRHGTSRVRTRVTSRQMRRLDARFSKRHPVSGCPRIRAALRGTVGKRDPDRVARSHDTDAEWRRRGNPRPNRWDRNSVRQRRSAK